MPARVDGAQVLIQSPTVIEWLEERYPEPPLLPQSLDDRTRVRTLGDLGRQLRVSGDVYLVPQVKDARRFKIDIAQWPYIQAVDTVCMQMEAFRTVAPSARPDAAG